MVMAMRNYNDKWLKCQEMIREKYGEQYKRVYDVWFAGVGIESYEPKKHMLTLTVPSKYVYEFLESYGLETLRWAISEVFGGNTSLNYRIVPPEPSFAQIAAYLQRQGNHHDSHSHIHIGNAREKMEEGMRYYLKDKPLQWLKGYDRVVEWLTDNKGRGLLVVSPPGRGKSLICQKVLPMLIGGGRPVTCIDASEMHDRLDELKRERIVVIDDLGKEPRKHYGDTDNTFFELCDNAERTGNLLIITTRLATAPVEGHDLPAGYSDSILHRYGDEVISRLQAITRVARFEGDDLRKE